MQEQFEPLKILNVFDRRYKKVHADRPYVTLRLAMSDRSVRRILHLDLHFHPYKIQILQSLNNGDYQQRIRFCENMLGRFEENDDQINNLWINNEAHSHLSGFVTNKTSDIGRMKTLVYFIKHPLTLKKLQYGAQFRPME